MVRSFVSSLSLLLLLAANLSATALFKPAKTYASGGAGAFSVAVADLNGDGRPDIVVSNGFACGTCYYNGSVAVLLGNGDGTFKAAQTYDSGGSGAGGIAIADVNGDGKPDVLVTNGCASGTLCDGNSTTGSVAVLLGNGDGTLQPARIFSIGNQSPAFLAVGDFNGDGKIDVATANLFCYSCAGDQLSVLLGNGDGSFQPPQTYDFLPEPLGVAVGDINGDGILDIAVGIVQLFGNGDGTFSAPQAIPSGAYPAFGDINGDGKLDLLVSTACSNPKCTKGGVGVYLGNGDGTFQTMANYNSGGYNADFVAAGDVNRDGHTDVFVANYSGAVGTLLGIGDGTLAPVQLSSPGKAGPVSMVVADVNGDGKPDLIVVLSQLNHEIDSGGIGILLNNTFWTTITTVTSSPNPSIQGQAVTFKATVVTTGSIAPTGKVVFKNGTQQLGSATLSGGVATLTKKNLPVGSLSITAAYKGDTESSGSTSTVLIQVVNP